MADGDSYRSSRVNGKPRPEAALGCALSAGENGGFAVASPYNAVMLAAGLCAISIAAVAVSVGCVPVVPPGNALVKSVEHADAVPGVFTHAARIFASVLQRNHTRQTVAQGSPIDSKKLDTKKDKIQF